MTVIDPELVASVAQNNDKTAAAFIDYNSRVRPDLQRTTIEKFAHEAHLDIKKWYCKTIFTPFVFFDLISDCEQGMFDCIIAYQYDTLFWSRSYYYKYQRKLYDWGVNVYANLLIPLN